MVGANANSSLTAAAVDMMYTKEAAALERGSSGRHCAWFGYPGGGAGPAEVALAGVGVRRRTRMVRCDVRSGDVVRYWGGHKDATPDGPRTHGSSPRGGPGRRYHS